MALDLLIRVHPVGLVGKTPYPVVPRQPGELLWLAKRQRPQQDCIHYAEDSNIRTDAQRQGQNRHDREAWILREHVQGIAKVLPKSPHG